MKIERKRQTEAGLSPHQSKNLLVECSMSANRREKTRRKARRHPTKTEPDGAKTKNVQLFHFYLVNFPRLIMKVMAVFSII